MCEIATEVNTFYLSSRFEVRGQVYLQSTAAEPRQQDLHLSAGLRNKKFTFALELETQVEFVYLLLRRPDALNQIEKSAAVDDLGEQYFLVFSDVKVDDQFEVESSSVVTVVLVVVGLVVICAGISLCVFCYCYCCCCRFARKNKK